MHRTFSYNDDEIIIRYNRKKKVLALQNAGGAIGNMICVNNVISACATTGISGKEGRIIRMNFIPCLLFWLLICISAVIIAGTGLAG